VAPIEARAAPTQPCHQRQTKLLALIVPVAPVMAMSKDPRLVLGAYIDIQFKNAPEQESPMPTFPKQPIVFHFQPEHYETADTPEKLKEWERNMREQVGLDFAVFSELHGTPTQCTCHGGLLDDSDYHQH
jgi:hypothetical protein